MFVRVKNGRIELCTSEGGISASFRTDVVDAILSSDEKYILATFKNGNVKLINPNGGGIIRDIVVNAEAIRAIFDGDNVLVTLKDGRTQLRTMYGGILREF